MLIKIPKGWEIPEREATPEKIYLNRRRFLARTSAAAGIGGLLLAGSGALPGSGAQKGAPELLLAAAPRNPKYKVDYPVTAERVATRFNNYYEFTQTKKQVWKLAEAFASRPWEIQITGLVDKRRKIDVDDLMRQMPLEERVYRHRCVEAWSMIVPWVGFPMRKFVEWCAPKSQARYVRLVSFHRPAQAQGQRTLTRYPWPYHEGLTLEEAANELSLLVVDMYGRILPNQNGAPLRLIVPWKYGFKGIKGITRFEFTDKPPATFWHTAMPTEYDFLANVDPAKPHPRWTQAHERVVETGEVIPTRLYNGYEEYVASLYR